MNPDDLTDEELEALGGAHVITLDERAIEGDPHADEEREARAEAAAKRARVAAAEAARVTSETPDEGSLADFLSNLPAEVLETSFLDPASRAALAGWLDSGEAPTAHIASGASLGFSDELAGAGSALGAAARGEDAGTAYDETRDRERERLRRTAEESPIVSGASEVAGGLLTAPLLPGPGAMTGAGRAARVAAALGEGALYGGAAGAGHSDADATTEEGRAALARDTVGGMAAGGAAGALGTGAMEGAAAVAPALRRQADEWMLSATGAGAREMRDLAEELGPDAARRIRESGLVPMLGTADDVATRARRELTEGGIGEAERSIADTRVPREAIADALDTAAARGELSPMDAPMMGRVRDAAERIRTPAGPSEVRPGPLTREEATTLPFSAPGRPPGTAMHELAAMDRGAAWARPTDAAPPPAGAFRDARRAVRDELDRLFREGRGEEALEAYRAARRRAEVAAPVLDAATMGASRSGGSRVGGLMDATAAGVGGAAAHALGADSMLGMGAGYLANRALHNYGRTARATVGHGAARAAERAAEAGPRASSAAGRGASTMERMLDDYLSHRGERPRAAPDARARLDEVFADEAPPPRRMSTDEGRARLDALFEE